MIAENRRIPKRFAGTDRQYSRVCWTLPTRADMMEGMQQHDAPTCPLAFYPRSGFLPTIWHHDLENPVLTSLCPGTWPILGARRVLHVAFVLICLSATAVADDDPQRSDREKASPKKTRRLTLKKIV